MDPIGMISPENGAIVALSVVLAELLKRVLPAEALVRVKPWLPIIVMLVAVALRAGYDAFLVEGGGLTWATVGHAVIAGAGAVWAHAQGRGLIKAVLHEPEVSGTIKDPPDGQSRR